MGVKRGIVLILLISIPSAVIVLALAMPGARARDEASRIHREAIERLESMRDRYTAAVDKGIDLSDPDTANPATLQAALAPPIRAAQARARAPIPDEIADSLTDEISNGLLSRIGDAETYLRTMSTHPGYEPIRSAGSRGWKFLSAIHERYGLPQPDATNIEAYLQRCVEILQNNRGAGFSGFATGPQGIDVRLATIYDADAWADELLAGMTPEENSYWFENDGYPAVPLRTARESREDVIAQDGKVRVALTSVIVRSESGDVFNWYTLWHYSPRYGWLVDTMARKGWDGYVFH